MPASVDIEEVPVMSPGPVDVLDEGTWVDLEPLQYPAVPQPVVHIDMDEEDELAMARFWAAQRRGELSRRVLRLTEHIILHINSAHYTVWEWRWRCLLALFEGVGEPSTPGSGMEVEDAGVRTLPASVVEAERELMASVASANPKNYQLWNARRRLATLLGPTAVPEELAFVDACLSLDAKNYHAWAQRQALVAAAWTQSLGAAELDATTAYLAADVRNNSAWAYRMFVLRRLAAEAAGLEPGREPVAGRGRLGCDLPVTHPLIQGELDVVESASGLVPSSCSAWNYLLGMRDLVVPGELDAAIADLAKSATEEAPWVTLPRACVPAGARAPL